MSDSVEFRHLEYLLANLRRKELHEGRRTGLSLSASGESTGPSAGRRHRISNLCPRRRTQWCLSYPPGQLILNWADKVVTERREVFAMARAIYKNQVPPLRLGFSPFVNPLLLQALRLAYEELFPSCETRLSSGDTAHTLRRLSNGGLDCAILPLPLDRDLWNVLQVAQSPLVLCMRADDPLASRTEIDLQEAAPRIRVFRDPELHAAAHSRLLEMFAEAGMPLNLANSAATPADMQWMVKENYGLALIDQLSSLEPGLITRPIVGVSWTADTAFVAGKESNHIALPLLEKYLRENGLTPKRKQPKSERIRPQQLKLIG